MTLSATTTNNSFGNPYFIPLPSGLNIRSAKIYVDLGTTQDDYVDLYCVTVGDMTAISYYLQGLSSLSNHQKIAADVNIDGLISVLDIIELQRTILGLQDYFNNSITVNGVTHSNVSAVYPTEASVSQLSNATFNISYSSVYDYNPFPSNILIGQNFVAIRLGDVNETCNSFFASADNIYDSYFCAVENSAE